jgi:hypothetical protein
MAQHDSSRLKIITPAALVAASERASIVEPAFDSADDSVVQVAPQVLDSPVLVYFG